MPNAKKPNNRKKKRKRRRDEAAGDGASPSPAAFDRRVFPILLAAAAAAAVRSTRRTQHSSDSTVRLLRRALSRSRPSLHPLPDSLVALLPLLLTSSSASVAALSCEVLGAAALQSMEASETLASDAAIANGLARALRSGSQRVAEAACNAVMDLSVSSAGSEHLAGSAVLPSILSNLFLESLIAEALSVHRMLVEQTKFST